jgi:hypothetical protein
MIMPRFNHGCVFRDISTEAAVATPIASTSAAAQPAPEQTRFGFLFRELQKDKALLTTGDETVTQLIALGEAMYDNGNKPGDSSLPAVFTYFGQLIAHDITWEKDTPEITSDAGIQPWKPEQVEAFVNKRSGSLDLDCVYGDATFQLPLTADGKLKVDNVAHSSCRPPNKGDRNDVPRTKFPDTDRAALIGDPRNDANTIISQLHVAFLHAHNNLMDNEPAADPGTKYAGARSKLVRLYQTIVLEDYLKRLIHPDVLSMLRARPDSFDKAFMPIEFSAAAFRFGHPLIRSSYALNQNFEREGERLSVTEMIGMPPSTYHNLPEGWIIQWERFVDGGENLARPITTRLADPLRALKDTPDNPFKRRPQLAVRDLLRGYIFRLPTGQSIATELGLEQEIVTADDFRRVVPESQWNVLSNSEFLEKTPLWFYVLAEAAREKERNPAHDYLGPVGSHLVGGVLMSLLHKSKNSILQNGNSPLGSTLKDLFRLAGVWPEVNSNA